jgi:hypothetical protein
MTMSGKNKYCELHKAYGGHNSAYHNHAGKEKKQCLSTTQQQHPSNMQ